MKKENIMKKMILSAIATISFASISSAQFSEEMNQLSQWLGKYYCEQNNVEYIRTDDPRYGELKAKGEGMFALPPLTLVSDMYKKIKQEFPMDPSLQAAVTAIENQKAASFLAVAQKYGYSSWTELWSSVKDDPRLKNAKIPEEQQRIDAEFSTAYSSATGAYYTEFYKRYETAVIEAIKRIQENAKAMK
jgi:hypothetical protein